MPARSLPDPEPRACAGCGKDFTPSRKAQFVSKYCSATCFRSNFVPTDPKIKHGYAKRGGKPREYRIWQAMKTRCSNPKVPNYPWYGGRGITVCERWSSSFENFLADMGPCPLGHSIDRFPDMNGNYEPNNCRWATSKQQGTNSNKSIMVIYRGAEMNISDAARLAGVVDGMIAANRIKSGWPIDEAVEKPRLTSCGSRYRRQMGARNG